MDSRRVCVGVAVPGLSVGASASTTRGDGQKDMGRLRSLHCLAWHCQQAPSPSPANHVTTQFNPPACRSSAHLRPPPSSRPSPEATTVSRAHSRNSSGMGGSCGGAGWGRRRRATCVSREDTALAQTEEACRAPSGATSGEAAAACRRSSGAQSNAAPGASMHSSPRAPHRAAQRRSQTGGRRVPSR